MLENKKIGHDIFIPKSEFNGAKNNEIVCVEITKWPERRRNAEGRITSVLGKAGKPGVDILSIMYSYNLKDEFPDDVIKEIARFAGCHIYSETDDVIYVGRNYITIHASKSGKKKISFLKECSPFEVYEEKGYGENVSFIEFEMLKGETKTFSV